MDATIFRKTEAGRAALAARDPALDPRTRTVLILVNGELDRGALGERLGGTPDAALQRLLALGLVEPAPARTPRPLPRATTATPADASTAPAPAPTPAPPVTPGLAADRTAWRDAAHRRALHELGPWYGPDAAAMAAPLHAALDEAALQRALRRLGESLSVIMGTPRAQALLARIRGDD